MELHLDESTLEEGLNRILTEPRTGRVVALFVRQGVGERTRIAATELNPAEGVVGDSWRARGSKRTEDGSAFVEMQVTLMNSRVLALLSGTEDRWALAGDQLIVDFDLSQDACPIGSRLQVGGTVLEITAPPHTGCNSFAERYGLAARKFVNTPRGRALNLRGVHAKVVEPGTVREGDVIALLVPAAAA